MRYSPLVLVLTASLAAADEYVPPAAERVPGYFGAVLPCRIERETRTQVVCQGELLEKKTLRELSVLRNTIYARYGWDGYRKPWLRDYFHSQAWFKANPKFTYKQLNDVDKKNAHLIAAREQSLTERDLARMRDEIYAHHGKVWSELPTWYVKDKEVRSCQRPRGAEDGDNEVNPDDFPACRYRTVAWYKPNPKFNEADLTADERVELGLISRALGSFALDDQARGRSEESLDRQLTLAELRQLSLRDLRLLRNTIYARRGRPFKSEILRDHFSGMSWYKVNEAYSDKVLSAADVRNIQLIKSVENEFGGPLSDEDWLTEPATDGA
jgi:hypothetical protein